MSNVNKAFSNNMVEFINNVKKGGIPDTETISFKSASPPFFYNNTNNYIIIKIKYLLELKIELKNKYILI